MILYFHSTQKAYVFTHKREYPTARNWNTRKGTSIEARDCVSVRLRIGFEIKISFSTQYVLLQVFLVPKEQSQGFWYRHEHHKSSQDGILL